MKLSDRLEMVVSAVLPQEAAADVGTDHGRHSHQVKYLSFMLRYFQFNMRKDG